MVFPVMYNLIIIVCRFDGYYGRVLNGVRWEEERQGERR